VGPDLLTRPLGRAEAFLFAPEDARRLAAVRIALFGAVALRLLTDGAYGFVAGQPRSLFDPVSVFHLLSSMPSPELTTAVQVVGVVAALSAACGLVPRVSFPAAFAAFAFLNLMLNGTGKIVHNDVVLTLCLLPLLVAPAAASRCWSVRRRPAPAERVGVAYGWPIRTAMAIVAIAYLFAGVQKLRYSGIDWVTSDNLRFVLWASSDSQASPNSLALFVADHAWIYHALAASTIVVEVGFILCLPFSRLRWFFVPAAIGLHLGIWAAMGLDYLPQAWTVLVVFVNWAALMDMARRRARPSGALPLADP
jgi:hypothetical protein